METQYPFGLSQDAIDILIKNPFLDEHSPLYIKDAPEEVFLRSPLFRIIKRILTDAAASEEGITLSRGKGFHNKYRMELYRLGKPEFHVENSMSSVLMDGSIWNVSIAREVCLELRLVKLYKTSLLITKKGLSILNDSRLLFAEIMNLLSTSFNWGYRVHKKIVPRVHDGCAVVLLHLMEDKTPRTVHHFKVMMVNKYLPDLRQYNIWDDFYRDDELDARISVYVFERFLWQLGLIEVSSGEYFQDNGLMTITRSTLLDELIGIKVTNCDKEC